MSSMHRLVVSFACAGVLAACSGGDEGTPDAGTPVEADAGVDAGTPDAGAPDAGTCGGFTFQYAVGWPCNDDGDCEEGLCLPVKGGVNTCTRACAGDAQCPIGMSCGAGAGDTPFVCRITSTRITSLAEEGTLAAGSPCGADKECAGTGAICSKVDPDEDGIRYTWCAPACSEASPCDACGSCEPYGTGRGDHCTPRGKGRIGEACDSPHDCASFECLGFCTASCEAPAPTTCADGGICKAIETGAAATAICIGDKQNGKTADGLPCLFDFQCRTGRACRAAETGTATVCTAPRTAGGRCEVDSDCASGLACVAKASTGARACQAPAAIGGECEKDSHCKAGLDCRAVGPYRSTCTRDCGAGCGTGNSCVAPDLDTAVELWIVDEAGGRTRLAEHDDVELASGNAWSELKATLEGGTYYVRLLDLSFEARFVGGYTLELSDGANTPAAAVEAGEATTRNDTLATAQALGAAPVVVKGAFDREDDVDWFSFTLAAPTAITVRTRRGDPSMCLPLSQVNSTALGGACVNNHACQGDFCESRIGACSRVCQSDGTCGAGFQCELVAGHPECVAAPTVRASLRGAACREDFECETAYCASWQGKRLCLGRCESAACLAAEECSGLSVVRDGSPAIERACVPAGLHETAFNGACRLDSDCREGLICEGGACGQTCATDASCPGSTFGSSALPAPACRACRTNAQCGARSVCDRGEGEERFCAPPCSASGTCAAGFTCVTREGLRVCRPEHGSCRASFCAIPDGASSGACAVPGSEFAEICDTAADCTTRACVGGLCSKACGVDADCGCATGDLICSQGRCLLRPVVHESEGAAGNDEAAGAQPLAASLPVLVYGELRGRATATGAVRPDVDLYLLRLEAGTSVDVTTRGVCGSASPNLDTEVRLRDADGAVLASGTGAADYGRVTAFTVPATANYLVEVSDDAGTRVQAGAYVLEVKRH